MTALDLTHLAISSARFFVSADLAHDAGQLTRLGNGPVVCDLLRRQTRHGFHWVPMLRMGEILRNRVTAALAVEELPWSILLRAEIEALTTLTQVSPPAIPGLTGGWAGPDGPMIRCAMDITMRLATTDGHWQGKHRGATEWPEWWARQRP